MATYWEVEIVTPESPDAKAEAEAGRLRTTNNEERGQANNGLFYDIQGRAPGPRSLDIRTTQDATIRQYFGPTLNDRKDIFKIEGTKIQMNDAQKRITITPGKIRKL